MKVEKHLRRGVVEVEVWWRCVGRSETPSSDDAWSGEVGDVDSQGPPARKDVVVVLDQQKEVNHPWSGGVPELPWEFELYPPSCVMRGSKSPNGRCDGEVGWRWSGCGFQNRRWPTMDGMGVQT